MLIILAVIGHIVLKYTKFGRSTYIIGNNLEVAREVGISDTKIKVILFACLGFVAGLCAVCFMLTYGSIPPSTGAKYEFYVNAGTVIGGCSVYGGKAIDRRILDRYGGDDDRSVFTTFSRRRAGLSEYGAGIHTAPGYPDRYRERKKKM